MESKLELDSERALLERVEALTVPGFLVSGLLPLTTEATSGSSGQPLTVRTTPFGSSSRAGLSTQFRPHQVIL